MIVILDIDNTLADNTKRYEISTRNDGSIDWEMLYEHNNMLSDIPIKPVIETTRFFYKNGYRIFILTSRPEMTRKSTEDWLMKHDIPYDFLYMRSKENHKVKDVELKLEMYNKFIDENVFLAIDDNLDIIKMWNSLKIPCYKVTI